MSIKITNKNVDFIQAGTLICFRSNDKWPQLVISTSGNPIKEVRTRKVGEYKDARLAGEEKTIRRHILVNSGWRIISEIDPVLAHITELRRLANEKDQHIALLKKTVRAYRDQLRLVTTVSANAQRFLDNLEITGGVLPR